MSFQIYIYIKKSDGQYFYNFTCALSVQQKSELLLVTSPVRKLHFVISRCLKNVFPKCFLLCVNPVLSVFCSQNSGENCSIRFRAEEASQFPPLVAPLLLHFYHVLVCCSLKFLPPKEIKESEIEGYGSLKGERWGKNKQVDVHKKKQKIFLSCNFEF